MNRLIFIVVFIYIAYLISHFYSAILKSESFKFNKDGLLDLLRFKYFYGSKLLSSRKISVIVIFSFLSSLLFSLGIVNRFDTAILTAEGFFLDISFNVFIFFSLLYLTVSDIIFLAIPAKFIRNLLLSVVLINFFAALIRFVSLRTTGEDVLINLELGTLGNIFAGVVLAGIIFFVRKFTNGKGIGEGDLDVMLALGLVLGWQLGLTSFLVTSILGGLFGLIYYIYKGKIKDVMVPYMPFITLGYIIVFGFGLELLKLILVF